MQIRNRENGVLNFWTNNTKAVTIDASQRVGIGTTAVDTTLHIQGANTSGRGQLYIQSTSGNFPRFILADSADTMYLDVYGDTSNQEAIRNTGSGGKHVWQINSSEAARIDSSGRLLVGTSTGSGNVSAVFQANIGNATGVGVVNIARGQTFTAANTNIGRLVFTDSSGNAFGQIDCVSDATVAAGSDHPGRLVFSTTADGASSPTERMRINSAGALLFGQTTSTQIDGTNTAGVSIEPSGRLGITRSGATTIALNRTTSDGTIVEFKRQASVVGTISVTAAATAYNTSSDYRLKENIAPLTGAIDRLQQIPVHRFNFIADPSTTVDGFIAHEAQAVVPECVTGTKDEVDEDGNPVYQGIDQSKLVPLLTAALQEAIAKIETLEAKVAALEGA
jgi:hypothetical protein